MKKRKKHPIDYQDPKTRREILIRQRRDIWTSKQIESFAKHFRLKPGMKLLDAGCGYGYILHTFGPYCMPGAELVGLDREKKLLATAKRLATKQGLGGATKFVEGDVYDMPFEKNTFDFSVAHVVFCHLAEPEKALDELIRVTKRGGCIAVFDNAIGGGDGVSWNNIHRPTIREKLFNYEVVFRMIAGRKKLGQGDYQVGCYVPGWMEARGLKNVDVRSNERVFWIAPPYRSPAQKTVYRNTRERIKEHKPGSDIDKDVIKQMRTGGADKKMISKYRRLAGKRSKQFRKAIAAGTAAFTGSGQFWCIWGFKP
ncbi:hypothetical protein CH330_09790 [candidate division WOR-3 bacterium JGI_Cruoil_03_51_56]|mgnify:CR=1 FL=1|uniref:Methyltransferase type 11 domain-containing protein n=1 Tax=candidate division WOR-3 bacterium JGI_Cruoil_03_51_56 TaxID=1973747 RepID=A0A235BPH9_UNCW3|nr:MAG: hypothetical protein CH330_09790 [candidate division WOR-3 bacterium JGI_Cruoil_03_51_56]